MTASVAASTALRNQERLALLTLRMAQNVHLAQDATARRTVARMTSVLGAVASLLATYDAWLLLLQ